MAKRQPLQKARPVDAIEADERILTNEELLERVPLDRSTIWRMVREDRFPKPIQLTPSRIGWRQSAVNAWIADREKNPVEARLYFGRDKGGSTNGRKKTRAR